MKTSILPVFLIILIVWSCGAPAEEETELSADYLEGSWRLVGYINHAAGDTSWSEYGANTLYEKYLTSTHFTWVRYDVDSGALVGTGGGTYTFDGKTYTEDIKFFFPPGANELGQAIPFSVEIKDGRWHHTGYAKVMEFDPEVGENVVVDSAKIEEIWERIEAPAETPAMNLAGSWELVEYRNPGDSVWRQYPEFVGYIKHITPSNFVWVYYNAEGDEVLGIGGGPYEMDDDKYVETLEFIYPAGTGQQGTTMAFSAEIREDGTWYHHGFIKQKVKDESTGDVIRTDSTKIEEVWKKSGN